MAFFTAFFNSDTLMENGETGGLVTSIFNANVFSFSNLFSFGFIFSAFISLLFLGMATLIHKFWEKKQWYLLTGLVALVFLFDAIVAFSVEKVKVDAMIVVGSATEALTLGKAFGTSDFWVLIMCGFFAYIVLGALFHLFQEERHKNKTEHKKQVQLLQVTEQERKIADEQAEADRLRSEAIDLEQLMKQNELRIAELRQRLAGDYIDRRDLLHCIESFAAGWTRYLSGLQRGTYATGPAFKILEEFRAELGDSGRIIRTPYNAKGTVFVTRDELRQQQATPTDGAAQATAAASPASAATVPTNGSSAQPAANLTDAEAGTSNRPSRWRLFGRK
jgi:hypothetical protein